MARTPGEAARRTAHAGAGIAQVARTCARRLVEDFGVSKVYLFGSLVEEEMAHDRSDIDLAVEGLEGRLYLKALRELWRLLPEGGELDLVLLERAWPDLAERVKTEGVLLDAAA
ncbi:MAG: nucleotidyltransferase family protein [Chloroflexota bacterium]